MRIHCIALGAYQTNSYVVCEREESADCVIVDAGMDADELLAYLQGNHLQPQALLLTHGHVDHIAGVPLLCEAFPDLALFAYCDEVQMLADPARNLSAMTGQSVKIDSAVTVLQDRETIKQAGIAFTVIHTPGHTPGGIALYCQDEGVVFAGDTLFAESIGRTDFPGGSMSQLAESVRTRLFVLPDETRVFPGHGPETTIGHEKQFNPFVK
jgi:hydroxyacylglutathione hydrolase